MNGKLLKIILNIEAEHALYREDGKWYHHLKAFPESYLTKMGIYYSILN